MFGAHYLINLYVYIYIYIYIYICIHMRVYHADGLHDKSSTCVL